MGFSEGLGVVGARVGLCVAVVGVNEGDIVAPVRVGAIVGDQVVLVGTWVGFLVGRAVFTGMWGTLAVGEDVGDQLPEVKVGPTVGTFVSFVGEFVCVGESVRLEGFWVGLLVGGE